jgi:transposase
VEALIAGERDTWMLAGLARGRLKAKRTPLIPALNGQCDEHHAEPARILLDQIDGLSSQIGKFTARIEELVAGLPAAAAPAGGGEGEQPALPAVERLMEVPGIALRGAQVILAEIGLDMTRFATAGPPGVLGEAVPPHHPVRAKNSSARSGKGNPYLKGLLGEAAAAAARPIPSSGNVTGGSPNAAASSEPWSPSQDPFW